MNFLSRSLGIGASVFAFLSLASAGSIAQSTDLFFSLGSAYPGYVEQFTKDGAFVKNFVVGPAGLLDDALGLRFGPDGNLYVASYNDGTVNKYNGATGAYIGAAASGLTYPTDVAFDSHGFMYVSEVIANSVVKVSLASQTVVQTYTGFNTPYGVLERSNGDLLVSAYNAGEVYDVNTTTGLTTVFASGLVTPEGLALGPDGRYYVCGTDNGTTVDVIPASGGSFSLWASGIPFGTSWGVFSAGNLYTTGVGGATELDGFTGAVVGTLYNGYRNNAGIAARGDIATPEPGSIALLAGMGLAGLTARRRR